MGSSGECAECGWLGLAQEGPETAAKFSGSSHPAHMCSLHNSVLLIHCLLFPDQKWHALGRCFSQIKKKCRDAGNGEGREGECKIRSAAKSDKTWIFPNYWAKQLFFFHQNHSAIQSSMFVLHPISPSASSFSISHATVKRCLFIFWIFFLISFRLDSAKKFLKE